MNGEGSPTARSGARQPFRLVRRGQDSTRGVYSGSCSVREPREGCGGFGILIGTRYLLAQRPRPPRTRPRRSRSGAHGPCHRPAGPFCHGGQARTPTGLDWSCRHPIPRCRGRGPISTAGTSVLTDGAVWCVSAGRTPLFPGWFRRVSYRRHAPGWYNNMASGVKVGAIHARRERRDSLAVEGSVHSPRSRRGREIATCARHHDRVGPRSIHWRPVHRWSTRSAATAPASTRRLSGSPRER